MIFRITYTDRERTFRKIAIERQGFYFPLLILGSYPKIYVGLMTKVRLFYTKIRSVFTKICTLESFVHVGNISQFDFGFN